MAAFTVSGDFPVVAWASTVLPELLVMSRSSWALPVHAIVAQMLGYAAVTTSDTLLPLFTVSVVVVCCH